MWRSTRESFLCAIRGLFIAFKSSSSKYGFNLMENHVERQHNAVWWGGKSRINILECLETSSHYHITVIEVLGVRISTEVSWKPSQESYFIIRHKESFRNSNRHSRVLDEFYIKLSRTVTTTTDTRLDTQCGWEEKLLIKSRIWGRIEDVIECPSLTYREIPNKLW